MPTSSSSTTATGEARDEDVKESSDGAYYALEDGSHTIDDGHEARTDGTEKAFDLTCDVSGPWKQEVEAANLRKIRRHPF